MRIFRRILLLLLVIGLVAAMYNYPRLNIIAGFSAKNMASSVFLGNRTLAYTDSTDNNFSPVNLVDDQLDQEEKFISSTALGLLTRKTIYREGLGTVLITDEFDTSKKQRVPKRSVPDNSTPFPFGNAEQKDSVFDYINYKRLNKAIDTIFNDTNKTRVVVAVHKNQIIAERYIDGLDKNSRMLGWSLTKSVLCTMFGILEYQGKINIEDKAPIAAWQNDARKEITINNLLQMNSGLAWDEKYRVISDVTKMLFLQEDMTQQQIIKPLVEKPGNRWHYSSGTSNLLSGILRDHFETHQEYLDFWYTDLIDKIGMNSMIVETDMKGNYIASSYAWATPRDWAKFGLLYLNEGDWNGTRLFDPSWIEYVTTPSPTSGGLYGAHFWLNKEKKKRFPDVAGNGYCAFGHKGQFVFIIPDKDLVVVRMGLGKFDINEFLKEISASIE